MSDQEKENRALEEEKKRVFLKAGVWIFSVLILSFWLFTLAYSFNGQKGDSIIDTDKAAWQTELNQTIDLIRNGMNTSVPVATTTPAASQDFLKQMNANLEEQATASKTSLVVEGNSENQTTATMTPEQLLFDLQQRLPVVASSSCPEFINCMPTIGEAKPCVIPPGCENITQIAY